MFKMCSMDLILMKNTKTQLKLIMNHLPNITLPQLFLVYSGPVHLALKKYSEKVLYVARPWL